jgi:hypothetical protein
MNRTLSRGGAAAACSPLSTGAAENQVKSVTRAMDRKLIIRKESLQIECVIGKIADWQLATTIGQFASPPATPR